MPRRPTKENKFYKPSPTMTCPICVAEFYEGYKQRHEQSTRHKLAVEILHNFVKQRTGLEEIYQKLTLV